MAAKADLKTKIEAWARDHNITMLQSDRMMTATLRGTYKPSVNIYKWFCNMKEYYLNKQQQ